MKKYLFGLALICVILSASIAFADVIDFPYYTVELTPNGIFKGTDRPAESRVGQEIKAVFRLKSGFTVTAFTASISTPDGVIPLDPDIAADYTSATISYTPQKVGEYIATVNATLSANGQSASGSERFAFNITEGGGGGGCNAGFGIGALLFVSALLALRKGKK